MKQETPRDPEIPEEIETRSVLLRYIFRLRRKTVITILLLALGATTGATLRYYLTLWTAARLGTTFPYGTLLINVSGSLILGCFMALASSKLAIGPNLRLLVATGFCGGFTTFSTFSYETVALLTEGSYVLAALNAFGSVMLGLVGVTIGAALARLWV